MRLHAAGLTFDELNEALGALLGFNPDPPEAASLLYSYDDKADLVMGMCAFNEWGLVLSSRVRSHNGSSIMVTSSSKGGSDEDSEVTEKDEDTSGEPPPNIACPFTDLRMMTVT
ncbi:hypothetical protein D1007_35995 [Hordeum vulgare]|nr:hypothetical protein D1007_35995 [Hordeum vulgare]